MPRGKSRGQRPLEEVLATLLQFQALFLGQMAKSSHRIDEGLALIDKGLARMEERLARIEAILRQHTEILNEHTRLLRALPEAIQEKIGFKTPEQ